MIACRIAVLTTLLGCNTGTPPRVDTRPCMGTPDLVFNRCGCHPVDDRLVTALSATTLPANIQAEVRRCAFGDAAVNFRGTYAAKVLACVETQIRLEPVVRDALIAIAATSVDKVQPAEVEAYTRCRYARAGAAADAGQ
jgi:hypothetical protein